MFELVMHLASKEGQNDDILRNLLRYLTQFACTEEHRAMFVKWLQEGPFVICPLGKVVQIKSSLIDQEKRFSLVTFIHQSKVISNEVKAQLLEKEVENDGNGEQSILTRHSCYASRPDPEVKKDLWERYTLKATSESLVNMEASMGSFVSRNCIDVITPYVSEKFFEDIYKVAGKEDRFYVVSFIQCLGPYLLVGEEMIEKLKALSGKSTDDIMKKEVSERPPGRGNRARL